MTETLEPAVQVPSHMTRRQCVINALAAGVTMPRAVAAWVKEQYQIDMTPAHVSTLKTTLSRGKDDRPVRRPSPRGESTPNDAPVRLAPGARLGAEDIVQLSSLAKRVGGFGQLQSVLVEIQNVSA